MTFEHYLDRTDVWVDLKGQTHKLKEMDTDYLENVAAYAHRKATPFTWLSWAISHIPFSMEDDFRQDMPRDFHAWVDSTPLMREINRILDERYATSGAARRWIVKKWRWLKWRISA